MSRCNSENWKSQLPWVLLGLRTAPKDADDYAPSEKVYGDNLTVPADFFRQNSDPSLLELRDHVKQFVPCKQTYSDNSSRYVPRDLMSTSHVFIRTDSVKPPLTPPYTGPYKVISRSDKCIKLQLNNKLDWVSIDRLKPAYLLGEDTPVKFSRAGRPLRKRPVLRGGSAVEAQDRGIS